MNAYSSAQVVFNIRGVSQNDYGDEQEPPVAVYQDDSYSSSINLASFPVFDLARVETLRGPQGTLFGRNATGGAIQFISRKPTDEFEGLHRPDLRQLQPGDRRRRGVRTVHRQPPGPPCVHLRPGRRLHGVHRRRRAGPRRATTITRSAAASPGSRATHERRRHPAVPEARTRKRQAGLYSNEPACPNAQNGRASSRRPISPARSGARARARRARVSATTPSSPSRGGDPWKTAETDAVLRGPRDLRRAGARGP